MSALGAFCKCDGAGCHWEFFYYYSGNGIWDGVGRGLRDGVVMVSWQMSLTFPCRLRPLRSFVFELSRPIWPKQLHSIDKLFNVLAITYLVSAHEWRELVWGSVGGRIRNAVQQGLVTPYFILYLLWRQTDHFRYWTCKNVHPLQEATRLHSNVCCCFLVTLCVRRNAHFWPSLKLSLRPISSLLHKQCKIFSIIFTCKTGSKILYCIFPETGQIFKKIRHISCNTWDSFSKIHLRNENKTCMLITWLE